MIWIFGTENRVERETVKISDIKITLRKNRSVNLIIYNIKFEQQNFESKLLILIFFAKIISFLKWLFSI